MVLIICDVRWLDRDTVLMNPSLPLEIFIPPAGFEHINLLMTHDRNGLNNGVFFLRVCEWSLDLFSTAMAFPYYKPEVHLQYTEQSAMEEVLRIVSASLGAGLLLFYICENENRVNNENRRGTISPQPVSHNDGSTPFPPRTRSAPKHSRPDPGSY